MNMFRREIQPPPEAWQSLQEWARRPWWQRFGNALLIMAPFTTVVIGLGAVALLIAEPSWRSVRLLLGLWAVGVPLTAFGYMRRMDRAAARAPRMTDASLDPTTAVDIRGNRERPHDF